MISDEKIEEVKATCHRIGYEYKGGYDGSNSTLTLECPKCHTIIKRNWRAVRKIASGYQKIFVCENCESIKQTDRKATKAKAKAQREIERETHFWDKTFSQMSFKQCKKCGKLFYSTQRKCYCSERCCKAVLYAKAKDKRLIKIKGAYKDCITLNELFKRDKGICYICGRQCDYDDYTKNGRTFIAGESYPSIDHVIPLSKGGSHSWTNVKLAHRGCNTMKGNRISKSIPPHPLNCMCR